MARTPTISETLRRQISDSGLSLVRLGKLSGTDDARLSRFMRQERGLSLVTVDKLCRVLGLRLLPEARERGQPRKKVKK